MYDIQNKNIAVLYHAECTDGFSSAWAAWKKFGDGAVYVPVHWGKPLPDELIKNLVNKEIYMVDFICSKGILEDLMKKNKRVTAIDHHESVEHITKMTQDYLYNANHSGAVLAWQYFHPDVPVPRLLHYVEDLDLWRFKHPETTPISMALTVFQRDFNVWDGVAQDLEKDDLRHEYLEKGNLILAFQDKGVEVSLNNKQLVELDGYSVYAVNAPHLLAARIGSFLSEKFPPFGIVWVQERDFIHVSLRSNRKIENIFDVSEIAKKHGGGGHPTAAAFVFPADQPFPWKIIR